MRDKNIKDVNNHILNNNDKKKKKKKKNPLNLVKLISSLFKQLIVDVKIIKLTKRECNLGVAKFDTTREPDTTRHEISRLWVEA